MFILASKNTTHKLHPSSGKYGPIKNPGLIHLCSLLADEKNLLKTISINHPTILPTKNKNAITKKSLNLFPPYLLI